MLLNMRDFERWLEQADDDLAVARHDRDVGAVQDTWRQLVAAQEPDDEATS